MNVAKPPIWVILRAHLAADARKTGVLAALFVVMLVIYVRLFWGQETPEAASAAPVPAVVSNPAASLAAPAAPTLPRAPTRIKPDRPFVRELNRDPFSVSLELFAPDPDAAVARPTVPGAAPEAQPAAAVEPEFTLRSTICGAMPMAWINQRCLQPGESIDGFVLERVEPARVVLRKDGQERILTMDGEEAQRKN